MRPKGLQSWLDDPIRGVLFDLDGVLVSTADLHFRAWKTTFDELLASWGRAKGSCPAALAPFSRADYRQHVDGLPRCAGARSFLRSRGLHLPPGGETDAPGTGSIASLANLKARRYLGELKREKPQCFPGAHELLQALTHAGYSLGLVSSSTNAQRIVAGLALARWLPVRLDGVLASALNLPGKPAPDTFLEAARRLGFAPEQLCVVEDAVAGVAAARAGNFNRVIGVDRGGARSALFAAGADQVVRDLRELHPAASECSNRWGAGPHELHCCA